MKPSLLLISVVAVGLIDDAHAQITAFKFESSPTSWVGHGQSRLFTEAQGFTFFGAHESGKSLEVWVNGDVYGSWILQFGAPGSGAFGLSDGPRLLVGNYPIATRWPFHDYLMPGSAGLSFSGQGRGDNELTGSFVVREFVPGPGRDIQAFAADFIQFDEKMPDRWNNGSIRFVDIPRSPGPRGPLRPS